jgi:hypothetical protein
VKSKLSAVSLWRIAYGLWLLAVNCKLITDFS